MKAYISMKNEWHCGFCNEGQDDLPPSTIPLCQKCIQAWKELVLEKRKKL